jgi:hypothetical protein
MHKDQSYVIARADALKPGEEAWFSEGRLRASFENDVEECGSLEAAVYSHLIGHYSLRKQGRGYLLIRHGPKAGAA